MKNISGKIIGGALGLIAGGPVGAIFGAIIGHIHDENPEVGQTWSEFQEFYRYFNGTSQQMIFTVGVIVLGAKMAKADGRVTRQEIEAFKRVFNVTPEQEDQVGQLFNRARTSASGFEPYAFQLTQAFRRNPEVLEQILGGLFIIAAADSAGLSAAEMAFLRRVTVIFELGAEDFERIAAGVGVHLPGVDRRGSEIKESYEILGLHQDATAEQIKLTYRALIRKNHPDRLMAQGMPASFIATANEKMKRINVAYDVLCKLKDIK